MTNDAFKLLMTQRIADTISIYKAAIMFADERDMTRRELHDLIAQTALAGYDQAYLDVWYECENWFEDEVSNQLDVAYKQYSR